MKTLRRKVKLGKHNVLPVHWKLMNSQWKHTQWRKVKLGEHDVLPVHWKLMNRFFAVIYLPLVSFFTKTSPDGLSSVSSEQEILH